MMTQEEHIKHWLKSADEDMKDVIVLFDGGRYVMALYHGHLYLEKVCKAVWVKYNDENIAPYTHNLNKLLKGIDIGLSKDDLEFLTKVNDYNIEARYTEFLENLIETTTKELAEDFINRIKFIDQCLRKKL
jgi:HEPN domain-containing protein